MKVPQMFVNYILIKNLSLSRMFKKVNLLCINIFTSSKNIMNMVCV